MSMLSSSHLSLTLSHHPVDLATVIPHLAGEVCQLLAAQGLLGEQLLSRRAGNELLYVFRFSKGPIR